MAHQQPSTAQLIEEIARLFPAHHEGIGIVSQSFWESDPVRLDRLQRVLAAHMDELRHWSDVLRQRTEQHHQAPVNPRLARFMNGPGPWAGFNIDPSLPVGPPAAFHPVPEAATNNSYAEYLSQDYQSNQEAQTPLPDANSQYVNPAVLEYPASILFSQGPPSPMETISNNPQSADATPVPEQQATPIKSLDPQGIPGRFRCPECDKMFHFEWKMKDHILTHSSVAHIWCLLCQKSFKRERDHKKHMTSKKHLAKSDAAAGPSSQQQTPAPPTPGPSQPRRRQQPYHRRAGTSVNSNPSSTNNNNSSSNSTSNPSPRSRTNNRRPIRTSAPNTNASSDTFRSSQVSFLESISEAPNHETRYPNAPLNPPTSIWDFNMEDYPPLGQPRYGADET